MGLRLAAPALAALALALAAPRVGAEMYKCAQPGGAVTFTSDPGACNGATLERHEPTRDVQKVSPSATQDGDEATPPPAAPRTRERPPSDEAQAASWKQKRSSAESELKTLEQNAEELRQIAGWCNRGGELELVQRTGERSQYTCEQAKSEYEKSNSRIAELRHYLDSGLEEECRQAGCLPGWIR